VPAPSVLVAEITSVFEKEMHLKVPSPETDLFESGVLDSMAFVDLLLHLEQRFGLEVSLEDLELGNFRSIARIAELVATLRDPTRQP